MFEAKLTITAPGLEAALNNLAAAIAGAKAAAPTLNQMPTQAPANPTQAATGAAPAPTAPQAAPQAGVQLRVSCALLLPLLLGSLAPPRPLCPRRARFRRPASPWAALLSTPLTRSCRLARP